MYDFNRISNKRIRSIATIVLLPVKLQNNILVQIGEAALRATLDLVSSQSSKDQIYWYYARLTTLITYVH